MKKARIFLSALTVLAVLGGVFAFKAKTPATFYTCNITKSLCDIPVTTVQETTTLEGAFRTYDELNVPCDINNPCETFVKFSI